MGNIYKIRFPNGHYARIVSVDATADPGQVRVSLALPQFSASLVLHVGAAGAEEDMVEHVRDVFIEQLAPLASKHQLAVLDGGTDSGVTPLMGQARALTKGTFPLIGVTPASEVSNNGLPARPKDGQRYFLEPNHTHFVLVHGGSWGIESRVLVGMGQALGRRTVAMFINGGEIARKEALMHARAGNPLLVLSGSGRLADEIVDALKRGTSNDILRDTLSLGRIQVCTPETLVGQLRAMLNLKG